jgi:hypothetical protein
VTAKGGADLFDRAHAQLRADSSIQFDMTGFEPKPPPAWLKDLIEAIGAASPFLKLLFWAALAAAVAWLLLAIARRVRDGEWSWRRRPPVGEPVEDWRPEEAPARALLHEADALAAAGRYDEAAHLLLFRSIEDIDRRRPDLVKPALTSRDIATAPTLPAGPKTAFGEIVMMVERSLFGRRSLGEGDWRTCRAAYEQFAFASAWRD